MALPLLDLGGTPRELGRAHGEAARDAVRHNVAVYFHRFQTEGRLPRAEVLDRAARTFEVIASRAPEYAEMMRGVAEASHADLLEIAALNARYEILYSQFSHLNVEASRAGRGPEGVAGECTAFAVLPEASPDGHLRIGQNWDWIPQIQGLLLRIVRPGGLRVLCFTEAGIVGGKIGLNSEGVGLVINGLLSDLDAWSRLRTPFHVRTWGVLNSRTLDEAVRVVVGEERSCSANFLLAQAAGAGQGRAVDIEAAPHDACTIEPHRGLLAHANHFLDPERLGIWQPLGEERTSTFHRCDRMQRLLDEHHGRHDTDTLTAILRDHEGLPESLCRHPNPLWGEDAYETVFSTVIDLHAREMLAAGGTPCTTPFERITLV